MHTKFYKELKYNIASQKDNFINSKRQSVGDYSHQICKWCVAFLLIEDWWYTRNLSVSFIFYGGKK